MLNNQMHTFIQLYANLDKFLQSISAQSHII